MGAIADLATYKVLRQNARRYRIAKTTIGNGKQWWSTFTGAPDAGVAPSTAVVCNRALLGSLLGPQNNVASLTAQYWLLASAIAQGTGGETKQTLILADRLSHQGGLSGIVTTAQSTNLPTAALTRYTSGAGVCIALEIYTAIGTTATTATVSYTNQAGTAGRTTQAIAIGGVLLNTAGATLICPLQDGDTGVQSVQSVTVLATTGTAGNFGVTLFKPLCHLPGTIFGLVREYDSLLDFGARIIETHNDACPMLINLTSSANLVSPVIGHLQLAEA